MITQLALLSIEARTLFFLPISVAMTLSVLVFTASPKRWENSLFRPDLCFVMTINPQRPCHTSLHEMSMEKKDHYVLIWSSLAEMELFFLGLGW